MPPAPPRIYLDNAATSFPKPEAVYAAMDHYSRNLGAAVGRGAYRESVEVTQVVARCRKKAAELLGAEGPDRIVFTFSASDSLNLALHGLLQAGDHVVTSMIEHNSVLRPLRELQTRRNVEVAHVAADATGQVDAAAIEAALRPNTRLIVLTHASNVTGTIQPIADVARIAQRAGVLFLVDAAQTAGQVPIDLRTLPIDLLACAGHKGLLGPLGTGLLYIRPGVEQRLASLRQGGTGTQSDDDRQPESLPDKYESGNHNAPGLFGLEAGLSWLQTQSVATVRDHEQALTQQLFDRLTRIPGLHCFGPLASDQRTGVVSVTVDGYDPQVVATILDESFGIQTRAGLHCAPGAHRAIGTLESGGTVRLSVGPFNTPADIAAACDALQEIAVS